MFSTISCLEKTFIEFSLVSYSKGKPTSSSSANLKSKCEYLCQSLSIFFIPNFLGLFAIGDPGTGKKPDTLAKFGSNSSNKFIVFFYDVSWFAWES